QESCHDANVKIRGIVDHLAAIDEYITKIAKNWVISRMAVVDRNILRLAIYEMLYCDDIPLKVSINEALEVAKIFADKDSKKFINGILDKVMQEIQSQADGE
ncbi:MAG: transcription antitermination factor NusB, partial [Lentisphaeria bacterium]